VAIVVDAVENDDYAPLAALTLLDFQRIASQLPEAVRGRANDFFSQLPLSK